MLICRLVVILKSDNYEKIVCKLFKINTCLSGRDGKLKLRKLKINLVITVQISFELRRLTNLLFFPRCHFPPPPLINSFLEAVIFFFIFNIHSHTHFFHDDWTHSMTIFRLNGGKETQSVPSSSTPVNLSSLFFKEEAFPFSSWGEKHYFMTVNNLSN